MSEERGAATVLVRQSELGERLGLPEGTVVHRMAVDGSELDPLLELVVTGPGFPLCAGKLERIPIGDLRSGCGWNDPGLPRPADEWGVLKEEAVRRMLAAHAEGRALRLYCDGQVLTEMEA